MLPEKFLEGMQGMLGEEYNVFLQGFEGERHLALRINPLKQSGRDLAQIFKLTPVSWERNGYYYSKDDQPGKHPCHEAGAYYIQEPSAMAVAPLLEAEPGERVLDLCAAPGGKSTQIAARLQGRGLLVSNEIHPARARVLSENIERMGVTNACVTNESPLRLAEKFAEYFDRILVDAPCSGEGMFRKNETACEEWSPENVELCASRQDDILDCAARMLRPGGRLVYSTCTFAPQENEGSVYRFLTRHSDFALLPIDKEKLGLPEGVCDGRPEWASAETGILSEQSEKKAANGREESSRDADLRGTLRLWPHHVRGEGHFAAVLQKAGSAPDRYGTVAAGGSERGISGKERELAAWWEFWYDLAGCEDFFIGGETITAETCRFMRFGDNLYLIPEDMPALKGLKVLRPGLHLGTLKKSRFEPSHALALALSPDNVRHICNFAAEEPTVAAYLNGLTFPYEGEKGWYLIAVDGYSVGWGKLAGGVMKNHYPKGLRKAICAQ